jgi:hypothetical protein
MYVPTTRTSVRGNSTAMAMAAAVSYPPPTLVDPRLEVRARALTERERERERERESERVSERSLWPYTRACELIRGVLAKSSPREPALDYGLATPSRTKPREHNALIRRYMCTLPIALAPSSMHPVPPRRGRYFRAKPFGRPLRYRDSRFASLPYGRI